MHHPLWSILTVVGSFGTGYLGAYLATKAKNRAMYEDIHQLVEQNAALTTVTKKIEAEISSGVWDRQKQWEMKREAMVGTAKALSDVKNAIVGLDLSVRNRNFNDPKWVEANRQIEEAWNKAGDGYEVALTLVGMACGPEAYDATHKCFVLASRTAGFLLQNRINEATALYNELERQRFEVIHVLRRELGIEVKLQSTGSSAAQGPD